MSGLKTSLFQLLKPQTRIGLIGLTGLALGLMILLIIGRFKSNNQQENIIDQNTIAVEASIVDHGIQFSSENIQPKTEGESYFVNYRLEREQARQETRSMLSALLDSKDSKTRQEAEKKWLELNDKLTIENEIENLLKIKGFEDAVANYNSATVNVIVFASNVSSTEMDLIKKIVIQIAEVDSKNVTISVKK